MNDLSALNPALRTSRQELLDYLDEVLLCRNFQDYAPNGLQVEGSPEVRRILCAVTASRRAIQAAKDKQADVLLVHHGMFWKNEIVTITGWKKQRIQLLLDNNINLLAYHLPLDAHLDLGNNAQWAKLMGWHIQSTWGEQNLIFSGSLNNEQMLWQLGDEIKRKMGREATVIGDKNRLIKHIAWCSGGAQGFFQAAIDAGVDAFITGEISEAQYHLAHETGVAFIAAGHHASEKYGIQALAQAVAGQFSLEFDFFDEENPA